MKTILESLNMLQDVLQKGMQSIRVSLKKELLQHPSQISYKNIAVSALSNERYIQRERSLDAEIRKTIREQPAMTAAELQAYKESLRKITHNKDYSFAVTDISSAPTSKANITGSIQIRNLGRKNIVTENDLDIWLKASFLPKIKPSIFNPDEVSESSSMDWFFRIDNCNLQYYDILDVGIDFSDVKNADRTIGLNKLRSGEYYIKVGLIKAVYKGGDGGSLSDGRIINAIFDEERGITEFNNQTFDTNIEFTV